VTVPAFWEHNVISPHSLIPRHKIDITPVKGVADMEITCWIRRRGIDYELWFRGIPVKIKHGVLPCIHPFFLNESMIVFLWEIHISVLINNMINRIIGFTGTAFE
jgi:hypothetical protein